MKHQASSIKHKLALLTSAAFLAGASSAAMAAPQFYAGAQAGYQNIDVEETVSGNWGSESTDYSGTGLAGGIFAGAKFDITPEFYLAPELNFGYSNADGGVSDSGGGFSSSYEVEAKQTYGLAALAGYNITDATSVYGRLGYQWTKFEATYSASGIGFPSISESESKTFGGVRVGVGMETAVAENVALRLDWSYTDYSSESFDESGDTLTYDPTESLFQIGVAFKF
ncbi:outer membrane immunogenic protein [Vreelandella aquamarina]|uniref:Outer membrane immunogenic protein n=1 Tax=Vreelandella aquamarina TaxID=77097 RepID=A0A1N6DIV1_9GAMM|nr:porin family protein [Halomonas meridiana]SIN61641.1 outer membrane immunogenic protein [Halomonas meridiana]SIN70745.1 outer membrane immunogenic protein [Halomonas meridiana]